MTSADHDQSRRSGKALHEHLGLVIDGDRFVCANGSDTGGYFKSHFIEFGGSDTARNRAIGPEQQLGAQLSGIAVRPYDGGQGSRLRAVVSSDKFVADVGEVIRVPEGFQVKVHGAAADQAIASGNILIEVVVLELRSALVAKDLASGKPDVSLDTTAAQRAHGGAVLAHEEHGAGLLRG